MHLLPSLKRYSPTHPSRNPRHPESTHKLQARATHGEVANKIPNESGELEDGRDEGKEEVLELGGC